MKKNLKRCLYGLVASLYGVAIGLTAGIGLTIATADSKDSGTSLVANRKNLQPLDSAIPSDVYDVHFTDDGYWLGTYWFVSPDDVERYTDWLYEDRIGDDHIPGSSYDLQYLSLEGNRFRLPIYSQQEYAWIGILVNATGVLEDPEDGIRFTGCNFLWIAVTGVDCSALYYDYAMFLNSPFTIFYSNYVSEGFTYSAWSNFLVFDDDYDYYGDSDFVDVPLTFFHETMWAECYISLYDLGQYLLIYADLYSYVCQLAYTAGYYAGLTAGYEAAYQAGYGAGFNQGAQGQVVAVSSAYNQGYGNGYVDGLSAGKPIGYDSGYDAGYDSGYSAGVVAGYSSGYGQATNIYNDAYSAGYDYGYVAGKNVGYAQGLEANNDTSSAITSLFFSIASVPWTILNGLGTFEIWNVSIIAIALGFLVAGIIFWLIRRFI